MESCKHGWWSPLLSPAHRLNLKHWLKNFHVQTHICILFQVKLESYRKNYKNGGGEEILAVPKDNYFWKWYPFPISPSFFDGSISSGILAANLGIKRFQEDFHLNDTWFPCWWKGKPYSICWDQISSHQTPQCNYFSTKYLNENVNEYQGIWSH